MRACGCSASSQQRRDEASGTSSLDSRMHNSAFRYEAWQFGVYTLGLRLSWLFVEGLLSMHDMSLCFDNPSWGRLAPPLLADRNPCIPATAPNENGSHSMCTKPEPQKPETLQPQRDMARVASPQSPRLLRPPPGSKELPGCEIPHHHHLPQ